MHLVMIGGSDAGISAALRARELDPAARVTVVCADAHPNFSICGIPYYISGEVTHWRNLAHRTIADLEAAGLRLRLDTTARRIDVPGRKLLVTTPGGAEELISYDRLVIGTGAVPVRPPVDGLDQLGPADGVHLLHSMSDTAWKWPTPSPPAASTSPRWNSSPRSCPPSTPPSAPSCTPRSPGTAPTCWPAPLSGRSAAPTPARTAGYR
jgi:hypothetical protein